MRPAPLPRVRFGSHHIERVDVYDPGHSVWIFQFASDPSHHFAGLRLNAWVSIVLFCISTAFFIWWQFFHKESDGAGREPRRRVPEGPAMAIPRGRR